VQLRAFCPTCLEERDAERTLKPETYTVRGEQVRIEARVLMCRQCGNEIFDMSLDEANVKQAYESYRRSHDLLSPEEIKSIRESYGLSQRALARTLGWGLVTIQRYEKGALQDLSHDSVLRRVGEDPSFLFSQFERNIGRFSEEESVKIRARLANNVVRRKGNLVVQAYEKVEEVAYYQDKALRGFQQFEFLRFAQVVGYLARTVKGLFKTKLAKLLWLSDFCSYALNGVSLTGLVYCRLPHGPAPDQFQLLLGLLESGEMMALQSHDFASYSGETVFVKNDPGTSELDRNDLAILDRVIDKYGGMTSADLSERSHQEPLWKERDDGCLLPYSEAHDVRMVQTLMAEERSPL
jgi:putative zinc finger/helix-turn-helix YgiT family protein